MQEYFESMVIWFNTIRGTETDYILLIIFLFVMPRILIRFRIPMALSAFGMGVISTQILDLYANDTVIPLFSFLGIVSLFLFAGLEVDINALKTNRKHVMEHLLVRIVILLFFTYGIIYTLDLSFGSAAIMALAVLTPSTGFILDSLGTTNISTAHKYWVKLKAISSELVALAVLFVLVQKGSAQNLIVSTIILGLMVAVLPFLFKKLSISMEKYAPDSQFSFLLMLAVLFGIITKKLGAYYLVGAFLVGFAAGRFRDQKVNLTTDDLLKSVKLFASFFMPFYFFHAGLALASDVFTLEALRIGLILIFVALPLRLLSIMIHRKYSLKEPWLDSFAVSLTLMPNLIFGLVLAEILKEAFQVKSEIYGGVIIYTIIATTVPSIILKIFTKGQVAEATDMAKISLYDDLMDFKH